MSIENGESSASVSIDTVTTFVAVGTYTIYLESYGDISTGSSLKTLKTDTVTIYMTEYVRSSSIESSIEILKGN